MMPQDAFQRLLEGNRRYVSNTSSADRSERRRREVAKGQTPFAGILTCADSRVPPEIIFDQGLGDLFVVRNAGPILDKSVLGSLKFGVMELHIPVVLVLGHTRCGAIKAALEALEGHFNADEEIAYVMDALKPVIAKARPLEGDLWNNAALVNVKMIVEQLLHSPLFSGIIKSRTMEILAGFYDLDTGIVEIVNE
jgi:carbonic anhydrase